MEVLKNLLSQSSILIQESDSSAVHDIKKFESSPTDEIL